MKKYIFLPVVLFLFTAQVHAQGKAKPAASAPAELAKLTAAMKNNQDSLPLHKSYIDAVGIDDPQLEKQYHAWMKQYPRDVNIPLALGQRFADHESPKAKPYLLKAVALNPHLSKAWMDLSIDAERWGDNKAAREYMGKASEADPTDAAAAFYYANSFRDIDRDKYLQLSMEVTRRFPESERGAQALYWLAAESDSSADKIKYYERLHTAYPAEKFNWSQNGMEGYFDILLETAPEKAIALAEEMAQKKMEDNQWAGKITIAQNIARAKQLIADGKGADAVAILEKTTLDKYSGAKNMFQLLKAQAHDLAGNPDSAYQLLLVSFTKEPRATIKEGLFKYGTKLGKTTAAIDADIWKRLDDSSLVATPFTLKQYLKPGRASLSDYKGKVVLLTYWFPGCGPCRGEMPHFEHIYKKYKDRDIAFLGINIDSGQNEYVIPFMRATGYSFTPLEDFKGREKGTLANMYGKYEAAPVNFLIDGQGRVIFSKFMIGSSNEDELDLMLSMMLDRAPLAGHAQTSPRQQTLDSRQQTLDSLKEVIESRKDSLPALRQYIGILGYSNDTVTTQFGEWMKQFPKSASIPYALGEAYYKAKDRKAVEYFIKAYMAGDTAKRMFQMLSVAEDENWALDVPRTANTVDSLRQVIEQNPDSVLPLQQYIFVLGSTNDTVVTQMNAWMKQFPKSPAIPFALGQSYYNAESPKATPYLLKVVALQPKNAKVWDMLNIDAQRWGNNDLAREYEGKAAAAEPNNADYAFSYADAFLDKDPAMFRKLLLDIPKRFPGSDKGAMALSWLAYCTHDRQEKIRVYEQLRKLYPPAKSEVSEGNMSRLFDLYLQEGLTDKAIELAASLGDKEGFPEKLGLAKNIATVREQIKEKKYKEAQDNILHLKLPRYSTAVNMVALLKAEVRDAAGSPQMAYDSLLLVQAKTPGDDIMEAVTKYGIKLGKDPAQTDKDIWAIRDKLSKPAPPFELGLYTSDAKAKLEDYRGRVVLLTFWFPGCGPCRGEMPHFQKIVNKYDKKDLAYLGINVSPDQDDYVLPFMRGTKYSFTPLRGNSEWARKVYHVRGEPTNFLIDRDGKIVYSDFMINGDNERMLELMISSMLAKKS